jgi:hypothetical protein
MGQRVGEVPYGYRVGVDGKTLVAEEGEQALIGAIREARGRGLSQRAVVADLERKGFTTRKGTAISLTQVQRIMQRENIA